MSSLVGVLITTYNDYQIEQALNSLQHQTFKEWLCVIVTDGCEQAYVSWLQDFLGILDNARFHLLVKERIGRAKALNTGQDYLRECSCDFVAILDSDDSYLERKLETQLSAMGDTTTISTTAYVIRNRQTGQMSDRVLQRSHRIYKLLFLFNFYFCHSTIMFRLNKIGTARFNEKLACCIDYDFYSRILRYGRLDYVGTVLTVRNVSSDNYFIKNVPAWVYKKNLYGIRARNLGRLFATPLSYIN